MNAIATNLIATGHDDDALRIETHTVTASARKNIDHSSHNHPATPKARASCRAMGGLGITHPVPVALNARVSASAKTVHQLGTETNEGLPLCGAKFNTDKAETTMDAVTCKNCLKVA